MDPETRPALLRTPALVTLALALVLAVAVGSVLTWRQARPSQALELESAGDAGESPFLDAVETSSPATFSDTVQAQVIETASRRSTSSESGTRVVAGDSAGLYGLTPQASVCDVVALGERLTEDPALASAWAGVRGITADQIPQYLSDLTALYLTVDTLVTNHRWREGEAIPFAAVLQAGTAVLVDDRGRPVVRCACGNPLGEAPEVNVRDAEITGTAWEGFDTAAVHTVTASTSTQESLRTLHVETAELLDVVPGTTTPDTPLLIVTFSEEDGTSSAGSIKVSEDGTEWEEVLQTSALRDVEATSEAAVAVGSTSDGGGIIHTSNDGRTWSQARTVIDPLVDVAHGDGVWVAVGNRSFAEESGQGDGSAGAVYLSADAVTWERVAMTDPYDNSRLSGSGEIMSTSVRSVAFGEGLWVMTATECAYRICDLVEFTSPDARTWTRHFLDSELLSVDAHHDGATWGFVGDERDPTGIEDSMAQVDRPLGLVGTSEDGLTWQTGSPEPDRVRLASLTSGPLGWYAVDAEPQDLTGVSPSPGRVLVSTDLLTWELLGTAGEGATGLAILGADTTPTTAPTTTAAPSATPSPSTSDTVQEIRIHTAGITLLGEDDEDARVLAYEGSSTAVIEALSDLLGEPRIEEHAGDGYCSVDTRETEWSGLSVYQPVADASAEWWIRMSPGTEDGGGPAVPVTTSQGVAVGMSLAEALERSPGAVREGWDYEDVRWERFVVDIRASGEQGIEVISQGGTVTSIAAPVWLHGDC